MEITIKDVRQILQQLLEKKISRESASKWAYDRRVQADNNMLAYIPEKKEKVLWDSILFIEGIDLQNEPDVYLHGDNDIREYMQSIVNVY